MHEAPTYSRLSSPFRMTLQYSDICATNDPHGLHHPEGAASSPAPGPSPRGGCPGPGQTTCHRKPRGSEAQRRRGPAPGLPACGAERLGPLRPGLPTDGSVPTVTSTAVVSEASGGAWKIIYRPGGGDKAAVEPVYVPSMGHKDMARPGPRPPPTSAAHPHCLRLSFIVHSYLSPCPRPALVQGPRPCPPHAAPGFS